MSRRILSAIVMALVLGAADSVRSQDDPFQSSAKKTELSGLPPIAVLFVSGAFGTPADSYSIYAFWNPRSPSTAPGRHRAYAVRKASRTSADVLWLTSQDCPALVPALESLENLQTPRIDIGGIGRDGAVGLVADGVSYDLTVRWPYWNGGMAYELRMSGNMNTPLAAWTTEFTAEMEPCWTVQPPRLD